MEPIPVDETKSRAATLRAEVQAHGFSWEQEILQRVYLAQVDELKTISYTSKVDLPSRFNRLNPVDLSIKTSCNPRGVCMADCLRTFDSVSANADPLHLVVLHYKQAMQTKRIVSIIEIDLTGSSALLFGSITRDRLAELDSLVKSVPSKRKPTVEERKKMYELRDSLQRISGAIHLDIKCNSTQSRLQCSFNQFAVFINNNLSRVVEKSDTNHFRGGEISLELQSPSREFKRLA